MRHRSSTTNLGRVFAVALMASALAPAAASANDATVPSSASGPTPDVVLSRSDGPRSSDAGSVPDLDPSRPYVEPAGAGASPDVILSRTDNPLATPVTSSETVAAAEAAGFDWGSAAIGAGVAAGLTLLSMAGLAGMRRRRRVLAG